MNKQEIRLKIMAYFDGELPAEEHKNIEELIKNDPQYGEVYDTLKRIKEVTQEMKFKQLPDMYWDEYWTHVYNRIERGVSWILLSIGAIIIGLFATWHFLESLIADSKIPPLLKVGIFVFLAGLLVLLISVVREKLMIRRIDKYREVER